MLQIRYNHSSGFFSCCSLRLFQIVAYVNGTHSIPDSIIDASDAFLLYKPSQVTDYFQDPSASVIWSKPVRFDHNYQFGNYKFLDYKALGPLVQRYFSPSPDILRRVQILEQKYGLDESICTLFYRGNDKVTETTLCSYEHIIMKGRSILQQNPGIRFLIQSDETEFIRRMADEFPNSIVFQDECRHIPSSLTSVDLVMKEGNSEFSKWFLAITLVMSKSKFIVCTTGNCSLWIMLYRGHTKNIFQFLNSGWV
jgi:hypothetical protein